MPFDAPYRCAPQRVKPEWIDYNGHLNMAYYNVLMDEGSDQLFADLGFGPDYAAREGCTTYSAEYRMLYRRELHEGDEVFATFQLLDHTDRSFHFAQELYHVDGWLSAQGEGVGLHIDQSGPNVAPMPSHVLDNLAALKAAHAALPVPDWVGRPLGLRRKG